MEKLTRKDFIKRGTILSAGLLFSFSKLGRMKDVKAAVSDNTSENNISDSVIYTDSDVVDTDVFKSGQKASVLAKAVNTVSANLKEKVDSLTNSFTEALNNLKSTNIAKATNITADNFPDAISVLEQVNVFTKDGTEDYAASTGDMTVTTVNGIDIPEGFYSSGLGLNGDSPCHVNVDRAQLLTEENLRDAGVRTVTDNGTYSTLKDDNSAFDSIEVNIDKNSEGIGNTIYNEGYDQAVSDTFEAAQSKSITAITSVQTVTPDDGKLLSDVTVNPQVHSETRSTQTISANTTTTIDLGEKHNTRYVPIKTNISISATLVYTRWSDPFSGAYNQGLVAMDLSPYVAVLMRINGLNCGDGKIVYATKGSQVRVGDYSGTSGGGRGFTVENGGIREDINGNSYGAWGSAYVSQVWGLKNYLV